MSLRVNTVSATGRIVEATDNAHVHVIEFHARSTNDLPAYVGDSNVSSNRGREIPPGESFTLNFALPDQRQAAGRVLLSEFFVVTQGGDQVDWSAVVRDPTGSG